MNPVRPRVRLRQAVLVAPDLEPAASALQQGLGLGEPYRDPGVAEFGLTNAVFAIGDCFLEVIAPARPGTAAGRYLERYGAGGYMVLFDLEDLDGARDRAERLGIRVVWRIDLPDISGTHLHPADIGGAIVSLDRSRPYGSWRWGGPDWTGRVAPAAPGRLTGVTVAVSDPAAVAGRWGEVLGVAPSGAAAGSLELELDNAKVSFVSADDTGAEGLVAVELAHARAEPSGDGEAAEALEIGQLVFDVADE
ncbi:MAG TPA: VOC family protein [Solirubrobacteraceae bacterium]|nr:VOC family protein [Solirubrobacteraceae bacterium]